MSDNLLTPAGQSVHTEARSLYQMLGQDGNRLEELRKLIAVPPKTERALRAFAQTHAENAAWIDRL